MPKLADDDIYVRAVYKKTCAICQQPFETKTKSKNICSFVCKKEHNRQHSRYYARKKRNGVKICLPCVVCGYAETTDQHREGKLMITLCPNHHALITRNIKTLEELEKESGIKLRLIP